ncbi:MAG: hypothetical protein HY683_01905 [Chloroflexi bacterium]|nr:hypothetical protein [Chloroflexota bacterium]
MERYFEDVDLGDLIGPVERVATDAQVLDFCKVWGMAASNRFTSREVAQREGFPDAIVPGIMGMAFLAELVTRWSPSLELKKLDVIFRQLVPHNRLLKLHGVVTDKDEEMGLLEADVYLDLSDGDRMVTGKAVFSLPHREG